MGEVHGGGGPAVVAVRPAARVKKAGVDGWRHEGGWAGGTAAEASCRCVAVGFLRRSPCSHISYCE